MYLICNVDPISVKCFFVTKTKRSKLYYYEKVTITMTLFWWNKHSCVDISTKDHVTLLSNAITQDLMNNNYILLKLHQTWTNRLSVVCWYCARVRSLQSARGWSAEHVNIISSVTHAWVIQAGASRAARVSLFLLQSSNCAAPGPPEHVQGEGQVSRLTTLTMSRNRAWGMGQLSAILSFLIANYQPKLWH